MTIACVLATSAASRQGRARENNEDAVFSDPETGIHLVSDGVGGLPHGEVASGEIARSCAEIGPEGAFSHRLNVLEAALGRANRAIYETGALGRPPFTMAATVVAVVAEPGRAGVFWVGDSRLYLYHQGRLRQMTTDHVELRGTRRLVTRVVGPDPHLELDFFMLPLEAGDQLLLCTDGVSDVLKPDVLAAMLAQGGADMAGRIVGEVARLGGRDDATAVVISQWEAAP
ncbi:serine/threonine phosphoprotein phosphatase Stp1 [Azorhizobium oxalatiphilum]|uniref:Serine/threonine phosphoprotein phosphatase Stp1 n=1 Tax=Azorhizobium oxalatiphilum TaxID=980631 RepID=A0A917BV46_9HYPH|nr:PP2C family serine/threonine-protein phosphatase [Azorhizobium oxalatiphilum]GGF57875.1 serine/threonine phosphoprotein phosphatase Stp1 [Azorhizobium oxalatiphilum]